MDVKYNWELIERWGTENAQLFRETIEFLTKKGATIGQALTIADMLRLETETACRPVEREFRDSLNNLKLKMP